jgi:lipopolysaccharide biosynthesis glycosyltransferase
MQSRIFITYHKDTHVVHSDILTPIQVGAGADLPLCPERDNSGDNISDRNDRYCEMTAAYWAWKNAVNQDYIGLLHYRRFLDFNENHLHLDEWGVVNWPAFTTDFEARFGLDDTAITAAVSGCDIVLPRKWSVRNAGYRNLREHYVRAPHHHASDLNLCQEVITRRCPEFLPSWRRAFNSDRGWFNNMFVFRHDIFNSYCSWLFPLLEEVEHLIVFDSYGVQERRVMGYLAERLLNVWMLHYLALNPETRVRELDRVFIQDPSPKLWDPAISKDQERVVSVVIASDDNYVPHLGALIASIFANISLQSSVDLLVLDGGISELNQDMLHHLVPASSSLHFIPMRDEFTSYFTHMHFSRATFYRLILDSILKSRDKVIYIDCDTIVLGDLCELWQIDMENRPIAAVHDYIMDHFCQSKVLSVAFTGSLPARAYLRDYVGIPAEQCDHYFQAGLLIMNLRRIRELGLSKQMTDSLLARKYWFLDQDILNKYFCGSHISLPAEWNFVNCTDDIRASLDQGRARELEEARRNIKLIHYAGYEAKPWVNRSAYLSEYYFYYLRHTFWYEQVLSFRGPNSSQAGGDGGSGGARVKLRRGLRKLWRHLPWFVRRVANPAAYSIRSRLMGG